MFGGNRAEGVGRSARMKAGPCGLGGSDARMARGPQGPPNAWAGAWPGLAALVPVSPGYAGSRPSRRGQGGPSGAGAAARAGPGRRPGQRRGRPLPAAARAGQRSRIGGQPALLAGGCPRDAGPLRYVFLQASHAGPRASSPAPEHSQPGAAFLTQVNLAEGRRAAAHPSPVKPLARGTLLRGVNRPGRGLDRTRRPGS